MSDGSTLPVPQGGVLAFVGPNNAGKSVSLRDIHGHLTRQNALPRAVTSIGVDKQGSQENLMAWLDEHCHKTWASGQELYSRSGTQAYGSHAVSWWPSGPPYFELGLFFAFFAGGEGRLQAANGTNSIDTLTQPPQHPLHSLYMDGALEAKVSAICERAFGKPLVLNRHAGSMVYLHVGEAPEAPSGVGAPPREYLEALSKLPRLDEQGDGMKSFMGLLLNIVANAYPIVLVDEPEAFLHPPQARLIGRMLGDQKGRDSQVFVATHDSDVLRGLLDSSASELTVVRLVRDGDVNRASQLEPDKVRGLWRDPLLRYSNVLDGLFHDGVVLCEGDADCRFYQAVLDVLTAGEPEARSPDLLFTHCGGKARMPTVIDALRAVDVPVRAVADFDVLREEQPLRRIVEGLGGDWASIEPDWRVLKSALDSGTRKLSTAYLDEQMRELLDGIQTATPTDEDERKIRALLKERSGGWAEAKEYGVRGVPAGDAAARLERLLAYLRGVGLFVVPEGELEGFARGVPGHGPTWVNGVLEQGLHTNGSLMGARDLVGALATSF
ncbi:MAG: AAA family ATPase [Actinomycetota bacterium]|nr:AAA family ATPase [Actinomycetota bacterium]